MVKNITIIDNNDNDRTQYVHISNLDNNGSELEIDKGKVKINIDKKNSGFCSSSYYLDYVKVIIEIDCKLNKNNEFYRIINKNIIEKFSDNDLINELKKRNILFEEIIYKIKE